MSDKGLLGELIRSLTCLPGVGPKSAQRMAFHLLERNRNGARYLGETLLKAVAEIKQCQRCRTLTDSEICPLCSKTTRDNALLCVVESPADVWVIEQTGTFKGYYFVLHGRLSPLDGIGPDELGIDLLEGRMQEGSLAEIILATNSTIEGEATAHFISELAHKYQIKASRIAHGVPMGGELEYIDSGTLIHAFNGRQEL